MKRGDFDIGTGRYWWWLIVVIVAIAAALVVGMTVAMNSDRDTSRDACASIGAELLVMRGQDLCAMPDGRIVTIPKEAQL